MSVYYSDNLYDEIDGALDVAKPIPDVNVLVIASTGALATLTDANGYPLNQPLVTDKLGFYSFRIPDPGDLVTLEYRYGGRLLRKSQVIIGTLPNYSGPAPGGVPLTANDIRFTGAGTGAAIRSELEKWLEQPVSVMDYVPTSAQRKAIAAGTDTGDHWQYFTNAIAAALAASRPLFIPAANWNTSKEIDAGGLRVAGDGVFKTFINATAAMRSVMRINGQSIFARDFSIFCSGSSTANLAMYGIFPDGINGSTIDRVTVDNASVSSIAFLEGNSNNTDTSIANCLLRHAGRRIQIGTATAPQGAVATAQTINLASYSSSSLAGLGFGSVRPYDFVQIGSLPAREIQSFDPSTGTMVVYPGLESAQTNAAVKIVQGSNIEIQRNGNSSKLKIHYNELQFGALAEIDCCSLYGVDSLGNTAEIQGYSEVIGRRVGGGESQPINYSSRDLYTEQNNDGGAAYYIGSCRELVIDNPMADTAGNQGMDLFRIVDPNLTLRTATALVEGVTYRRRVELTNLTSTNITPGADVELIQSSGASDITLYLTAPPVGSNARQFLAAMSAPITINTGQLGGKRVFIKTQDGSAINGADGSVGLTLTTEYNRVLAVWSNYGWRVYGVTAAPSKRVLHANVGGAQLGNGSSIYTDFSSSEFGGADFTPGKSMIKVDASGNADGTGTDPSGVGRVTPQIVIRTATQLRVQLSNGGGSQTVNCAVEISPLT